MQQTSNELDTYIKLKYGYPLTEESYNKMPDKLVKKIYLGLVQQQSSILSCDGIRRFISSAFAIHKMFSYTIENDYSSENAWEIIRKYHRNEKQE